MKEKREIHLAVNENQIASIENALIKYATDFLKIKSNMNNTGDYNTPHLDTVYNDTINAITQVKKERQRLFKSKLK